MTPKYRMYGRLPGWMFFALGFAMILLLAVKL